MSAIPIITWCSLIKTMLFYFGHIKPHRYLFSILQNKFRSTTLKYIFLHGAQTKFSETPTQHCYIHPRSPCNSIKVISDHSLFSCTARAFIIPAQTAPKPNCKTNSCNPLTYNNILFWFCVSYLTPSVYKQFIYLHAH